MDARDPNPRLGFPFLWSPQQGFPEPFGVPLTPYHGSFTGATGIDAFDGSFLGGTNPLQTLGPYSTSPRAPQSFAPLSPFQFPSRGDLRQPQILLQEPIVGFPDLDSENAIFRDLADFDGDEEQHEDVGDLERQTDTVRAPKRSRISHGEWERHRDSIKKLYIDEGKSLGETRQCMITSHDFNAPEKAYKAKFREWKLSKNLPTSTANWMLVKADKRKRELNRDSRFEVGQQIYTVDRAAQALKRAKINFERDSSSHVMATPPGVRCFTPFSTFGSPRPPLPYSTLASPRPPLHAPVLHTYSGANERTWEFTVPPPRLPAQKSPTLAPILQSISERVSPEGPQISEDPIEYARRLIDKKNPTVEPYLLDLIRNNREGENIHVSIEARSLLVDLYCLAEQPRKVVDTFAEAQGMIRAQLNAPQPIEISTFIAIFGLICRFAENDCIDRAKELFSRLTAVGKKVFLFSDDDMACFLVGIGKLFQNTKWDIARGYFEHALSVTMGQDQLHLQCQALQILQECLKKRGLPTSLASMTTKGITCGLAERLEGIIDSTDIWSLQSHIFTGNV